MAAEPKAPQAKPGTEAPDAPPIARVLMLWIVLIVGLEAALWISGARQRALDEAVEQGAARVETRAFGEVQDYLIRKAIRTQRDTLPFWTTLALLADFVIAPLAPALRAVFVATLLSSLAALTGRTARFRLAFAQCLQAQGLWVLGLAVRVALVLVLRRPEAEMATALALPAGTHPAWEGVLLAQADPFAMWGWALLAWGGWRRGEANLVASTLTCSLVALTESAVWISGTLVLGAAMRLTVLPR